MRLIRQYESVIYGNYHKAALQGGVVIGLALLVYILLFFFVGNPISSPETFGIDGVLFLCTGSIFVLYRRRLPDGKVSMKELMLLGVDACLIGAALYGVELYLYATLLDVQFSDRCFSTMAKGLQDADDTQVVNIISNYSAVNWALMGCVRLAVMSIIFVLVLALCMRTEKSRLKQ
ncbi:MAG: DUF4199 domain-containing protein [Bacteroidales bacterium]|nr:DUF4199 domain-containing protein [Bacteroidales bacterium]